MTAKTTYVGVPQSEFAPFYRHQEMSQWCWASSTAMILRHSGIEAEQDAIVEKIKGWKVNAPGNPVEMMRASNFVMKDENDASVVASGEFTVGAPLPNAVFNHLNRKKPFVLNYNQGQAVGHAVVVFGADVELNLGPSSQQVVIKRIYVADPFVYQKVKYRTNPDGSVVHDPFNNPIPEIKTWANGNPVRDQWGRFVPVTAPDETKRFVTYTFDSGEFGAYRWLPGTITGALFVEATTVQ